MIKELTEEQKGRMQEFVVKWTAIGLCTDPMDKPAAVEAIAQSYAAAKLSAPKTVIFCSSPMDLQITANSIQQDPKTEKLYLDKAPPGGGIAQMLSSDITKTTKDLSWKGPIYGQHDAAWLAFYDYFREVCGLETETAPLLGLTALAKCAGWAIPYDSCCLIAERHNKVELNPAGQLHCDGGAAVEYPDGFSVWALNGVRVPQWLAERPPNEILPEEFAKLENAEIRREFIRKVGVEHIVSKLGGKVLDASGDYELVTVDLKGETGYWPYLKMKNPSLGVWHMEAVPKEISTVQEALNWRNGGEFEYLQEMT